MGSRISTVSVRYYSYPLRETVMSDLGKLIVTAAFVIISFACVREPIDPAVGDADGIQASVMSGQTYYVSTSGASSGTGAFDDPWELQYALDGAPTGGVPRITGGDVVLLKAGTYDDAPYFARVSGNSTARVLFRNNQSDQVRLQQSASGCGPGPGIIRIEGIWFALQGVELTNIDPVRQTSTDCDFRPKGIYNTRSFNAFVNLIIHDVGSGIYNEDSASGVEISGNIIYNNGWQGSDRGHGHGLYLKNTSNMVVRGNVLFNNFQYGVHVYTELGDNIDNISLIKNVAFNNGTLSLSGPASNILVGGKVSSTGNVVDSNMTFFSSPETGLMSSNVEIGYQAYMNGAIIIRNNYFVGKGLGDAPVFQMGYWQTPTVNNNTFVGCKPNGPCAGRVVVLAQCPQSAVYSWSNNVQHRDWASVSWWSPQWRPGNLCYGLKVANVDFSTWRSTSGIGATDQGGSTQPPSTTKTFVWGTPWEQGRATVVVYNWQNLGSVAVNLTGIVPAGWWYRVRNVQQLSTSTSPVQYSGAGSVNIAIQQVNPPQPTGWSPTGPSTGTGFQVYIVTAGPTP
jgi:hypothetical protein